MPPKLTYLITGANRGIGKGFVSALLQNPSTTVIAAVRDPSNESSKALLSLPKSNESKLIIIKIDSSVHSDPSKAISQLQKDHNISSIDVVIANAGINHSLKPVIQNTPEAVLDHFVVNTVGPLALFQASAELLKSSKERGGNPIFVPISTAIGTISGMELLQDFPAALSPYGGSKAALNWFIRRIHFEEPWLTSFVFHPGLVLTDMIDYVTGELEDPASAVAALGAISVGESVSGMLKVLSGASRNISGTFQQFDGTTFPW